MTKLIVKRIKLTLIAMFALNYYLVVFAENAHAIIILAPVFIGLTSFLGIILTIASLPTLLLAMIINIDNFRTSKLKFALLTLFLWLMLLGVIGVGAYLYYNR